MVKASACTAEDPGSIPGSGRSPEEGNTFPLQYSCLENLINRGAWWAMVHKNIIQYYNIFKWNAKPAHLPWGIFNVKRI